MEYNFRCRMGEVDLIARDGDYLVFVEVKYRGSEDAGGPLSAVGYGKQRTISRVAKYYLLTHCHTLDIACRFDVIGFHGPHIRWLKNAFDYCG